MSRTKKSQKDQNAGVIIKAKTAKITNSEIAGKNIIKTTTTTNVSEYKASEDEKELEAVLAEILKAVQQAPKSEQSAAIEKVEAIKELALEGNKTVKAKTTSTITRKSQKEKPHDGILAGLVTDLVDLVPGAVAAVVSAIGTPLLGGIAGPITAFAVSQLKKRFDTK